MENLRKSRFHGNLCKTSAMTIRKIQKIQWKSVQIYEKSAKTYRFHGNLWKSAKLNRNRRKSMEIFRIHGNLLKSAKVNINSRKFV